MPLPSLPLSLPIIDRIDTKEWNAYWGGGGGGGGGGGRGGGERGGGDCDICRVKKLDWASMHKMPVSLARRLLSFFSSITFPIVLQRFIGMVCSSYNLKNKRKRNNTTQQVKEKQSAYSKGPWCSSIYIYIYIYIYIIYQINIINIHSTYNCVMYVAVQGASYTYYIVPGRQ